MTIVSIAALALATTTDPDPGRVRAGVGWVAPPPCPSAAEVDAKLQRETGPTPELGTGLGGHAVVAAAPDGYRMRVTLRDGGHHSSRSLSAEDCATLADAYVLQLRVLAHRTTPRQPTPANRPGPTAHPELGVSAILFGAGLPTVAGGAAVWGGWLGRHWVAGAELSHAVARRASLGPDAEIQLQRFEASVSAGPALRRRWGDVSLSAGAGGGSLLVRPSGPIAVARPRVPWLTAHAALRLSVALTARLALTAAARSSWTPQRIHFDRHLRAPLSTPRWGFRALLGAAIRFPNWRRKAA